MIATPYLLFVGDEDDRLLAKTAAGIAHWRREICTGVWRLDGAGGFGLPGQDPAEAVAAGAKTLVIGVVNSGGILPPHWIAALHAALAAGLDIANGLHTRLREIPELVTDAARLGRTLHDVRDPGTDFPVGTGVRRTGRRLLTVGTDCVVGKMFTALTIERALRRRGVDATFRATGQTGILIAGDGVPIDAVVSDFVSGAAEALSPDADPEHWDVIEGQGSLFHPAFAAVSLGLLHGSQPDAMILCHAAGRTHMAGTAGHSIPDMAACIAAYEAAARVVNPGARVTGISINTSGLSDVDAGPLLQTTAAKHDLPVGDPVRTGLDEVVSAILADVG